MLTIHLNNRVYRIAKKEKEVIKKMSNSKKFDYAVVVAVVLFIVLLFLTNVKVSTYYDGTITTRDFSGNVEVETDVSYSEFVRRKN